MVRWFALQVGRSTISQFDLSLKNTQSISAVAIFACQFFSDVFVDPLPHGLR